VTDYERLAADMTAAGLPGTVAGAYRLATRAFRGEAMTDKEMELVATWEARTASTPCHPETARDKRGN
jgi:hypothetical protein